MKDKSIRTTFWILVLFVFIIIATKFIGTRFVGPFPLGYILLTAAVIYLVLGTVLLVLTVKKRVDGITRKFLLLTGASAVGLPVLAVLHNLVTALCIGVFGFSEGFDEPAFFLLAAIVCPLGFLVGAVGTIILSIRNQSGQIVA